MQEPPHFLIYSYAATRLSPSTRTDKSLRTPRRSSVGRTAASIELSAASLTSRNRSAASNCRLTSVFIMFLR